MRIASGRLKGRRVVLKAAMPERRGGHDLRPTSSKVREALFDILRGDVEGSFFLDLYAGTGAVGLEALSRGAEAVTFVEESRVRCNNIGDYIRRFGVGDRAAVDCSRALDFLRKAETTYDIIFADPPYKSDELTKVLPAVAESRALRTGGCLVIEHPSKTKLGDNGLKLVKSYRYGDATLTLYRKEE